MTINVMINLAGAVFRQNSEIFRGDVLHIVGNHFPDRPRLTSSFFRLQGRAGLISQNAKPLLKSQALRPRFRRQCRGLVIRKNDFHSRHAFSVGRGSGRVKRSIHSVPKTGCTRTRVSRLYPDGWQSAVGEHAVESFDEVIVDLAVLFENKLLQLLMHGNRRVAGSSCIVDKKAGM